MKSRRIAPEGLGLKITDLFHAYWASSHEFTSLTSASLVFGRGIRLPCDLLFGALPDKERPTIDHAANFVDNLHDILNYASQHLIRLRKYACFQGNKWIQQQKGALCEVRTEMF
jgi:hypothetical protein